MSTAGNIIATMAVAVGSLILGIIFSETKYSEAIDAYYKPKADCEASLPRDQPCVMYFKPEDK